ncbi:MAG: ZIP family metal transporter [Desulfurococcales archaeon]|nr:ZIP family metal transporter [Desulfurococcales archaeon]
MTVLIEWLSGLGILQRVFIIGLIPFALTAVGSVPILSGFALSRRFSAGGLGFSAGVMLVASFTSLLIPALESASVLIVIAGFIAGVALIKVLDVIVPHLHIVKGYEGPSVLKKKVAKAWLIALAMIVHNIPEGMAVGAVATYGVRDGLVLALAIGIQDIPEGLAVAVPIAVAEGSRGKGFAIGVLSGLSEALAALIPVVIIQLTHTALPLLMSLAAGAMVYVVIHEIIPDVMKEGEGEVPTAGFLLGFVLMLALDMLFA